MATPQNGFTFQIKNPGSTKNKTNPNMMAMKKIDNYSYALNDQIGLGFTSHVYKGKCQLTNMPVAVKVIELKKNQDELHANFLKQEVAVLETIKNADSKNLLKLEKVIKSKNNLYIITEFCEGNDVAKILRKKKFFRQKEAQSIMKQVLNGYKQLYKLKIVHRDLKLANLFITKGNVKIADFGFAIGEEQCQIKIDYNVGSPYYMPPESLKRNEYSYLSDVWAIGVIAYQLVYGKVPWKDKDDEVLHEMILTASVDKLFQPNVQLSDHFKRFIQACLTVDVRFRASPQFIINYQWPMAEDYVDGLEEENQFRHSMGGRVSFPRMSEDKPELKKLASENNSQPLILRKRTPSMDNLINIVRNQQRPPSRQFPPRSNEMVTKSFIQQERVILYNEGSREKASTVRSFQVPSGIGEKRNETQKATLGQIHFCRFMMELLKILHTRVSKNEKVLKIEAELGSKITQKVNLLVKMAQSQENVFKCPGFEHYIKTERWQALRQVIYKYDMKFREELMGYSLLQKFKAEESQVIQVMREMKSYLPTNLKIVEILAYYYQIREEESKIEPQDLEERTKISYIVDECKRYLTSALAEKNLNEVNQRKERLVKKLALLGI